MRVEEFDVIDEAIAETDLCERLREVRTPLMFLEM